MLHCTLLYILRLAFLHFKRVPFAYVKYLSLLCIMVEYFVWIRTLLLSLHQCIMGKKCVCVFVPVRTFNLQMEFYGL
jgi:hypothetical protein